MAAFGLKAMAAFAHGKKILARESFWTVLCAFFSDANQLPLLLQHQTRCEMQQPVMLMLC